MASSAGTGATRATVEAYFDKLRSHDDWAPLLAEDVAFASFTSPVRSVVGRTAFVAATKRFYSMIRTFEVLRMLVDEQRACALTRYVLAPPSGEPFESHVAEIFEVKDSAIVSFGIYFDSAPYPK